MSKGDESVNAFAIPNFLQRSEWLEDQLPQADAGFFALNLIGLYVFSRLIPVFLANGVCE